MAYNNPAYINPAYTLPPSINIPPINIPLYCNPFDTSFSTLVNNSNSYQIICPHCRGEKKILYTGEEMCNSCAGLGRHLKSNCWSAACLICRGSGRVSYCRSETCRYCQGRGTLAY